MKGSPACAADDEREVSNMWEYTVFRLWEYVGGPLRSDRDWRAADPMNDTGGTAGLLNARGAEGRELVSLVERRPPGRQGWRELRRLHEAGAARLSDVSLAKRQWVKKGAKRW
jgi:hypothetical protein